MAAPHPIAVVSSWSGKAHAIYGKRFLETLVLKWPTWVQRLRLFSDAGLLRDPDVAAFREREADAQTLSGDYRRGALKWSWKVFAIYEALRRVSSGWLIWIDGDVEFTKAPTLEFLAAVCPPDKDISFLGRPWAYASETGFVAYNIGNPCVRQLIGLMRQTYLDGSFRELDNWGDAAVFDHCRKGAGLRENDLAADCKEGNLHVWPQTILGEFMRHQKGPGRKREAYGDTV